MRAPKSAKIVQVVVTIEDEGTTTSQYSGVTGVWSITGPIYARHLTVLEGITDL